MWNITRLARHGDGCTFIRRDGLGFEKEGAVRWEVIIQILDDFADRELEHANALSVAYTAWWSQNPEAFYITVHEFGATYLVYEYAEETDRDAAAQRAMELMFEELKVEFNFQRIRVGGTLRPA